MSFGTHVMLMSYSWFKKMNKNDLWTQFFSWLNNTILAVKSDYCLSFTQKSDELYYWILPGQFTVKVENWIVFLIFLKMVKISKNMKNVNITKTWSLCTIKKEKERNRCLGRKSYCSCGLSGFVTISWIFNNSWFIKVEI